MPVTRIKNNVITDNTVAPAKLAVTSAMQTFLGNATSANLASAVTGTTGSGNLVFSGSPVLTSPNLGTPISGNLINCTGLPISTGVSGLGTGVSTFLQTPTSANLAAAVTGETGTGGLVFATAPSFTGPVDITSQDASTADRVMTRDLASYEAIINGNEFRQFCFVGSQQFGTGSGAFAYNVVGMSASISNALSGSASAYTYDGVLSNSGFSGHPLRTNLLVDMFFHGVMLRVEANTNWVARINFGVGAATRVPPAAGVAAASSRQWGVEFYYDGVNYVGRMYWYDTSIIYGTPFTIPAIAPSTWPNLIYSIRMRQTTSGLLEFYINTPISTLGGGRLSNTPTASMQATWTNSFYGGRHINFEVANGTAAASGNTRIHATNMYGRVKYEL